MRTVSKFVAAFAATFVLLLAVKTLAVTVYTVDGDALAPTLVAGDRVLVSRWSYGLRVGGSGSLFGYGRLGRSSVRRGDLVAYESPADDARHAILIGRCAALPGDTIRHGGRLLRVPSTADCADADYYWIEADGNEGALDSKTLGFIAEEHIIGRAIAVLYSLQPDGAPFTRWRKARFLLPL